MSWIMSLLIIVSLSGQIEETTIYVTPANIDSLDLTIDYRVSYFTNNVYSFSFFVNKAEINCAYAYVYVKQKGVEVFTTQVNDWEAEDRGTRYWFTIGEHYLDKSSFMIWQGGRCARQKQISYIFQLRDFVGAHIAPPN